MKTYSLLAVATVTVLGFAAPAVSQDQVTFLTNWRAQAEHGGFYQAVADGTYEAYGLDVTIEQGGPQSPGRPKLAAGQVQFYMAGASGALDAVRQNIPTVAIAAIFQKDPQVLISHPGRFSSFGELAGASKYIIGAEGFSTFFQWMKKQWPEFVDEKYEPYHFNPASFLADEDAFQQGYVTSEPFAIEREAGFTPDVWLLADEGYAPYSTTIEVMRPWLEDNKDVARRFVEASIIGWYNYLYGDNAAANELIKVDNPEMTDDAMASGLARMKEYSIVISGDAETKGIGCMTDAGWKAHFDTLVAIGLLPADLDYTQAFTTEFVCQGLGTDLVQ